MKILPLALLLALSPLLLPIGSTPTARAEDDPTAGMEDASNPRALITTSHGEIVVELFASETPKTVESFLGLAEGTRPFTDRSGETVTRPYYDGLTFHRVIDGFMIQGGCPLGTGSGGPGYNFEDEINATSLGLHELKAFDATKMQPHPWMLIRSQTEFQQNLLFPLLESMGIPLQQEMIKAREADIMRRLGELTLKEAYENRGYRYTEDAPSHAPRQGTLAMANTGANSNGSQFFIVLEDALYLTGKHTVFGRVLSGMDIVKKIGKVAVDPASKAPVQPVKILKIRRAP